MNRERPHFTDLVDSAKDADGRFTIEGISEISRHYPASKVGLLACWAPNGNASPVEEIIWTDKSEQTATLQRS